MTRVDCIVDELIVLEEALRKPNCIVAYAIWRDFDGDIHADDFSLSSDDRSAAIQLFNEIAEGYEPDDYHHIFTLSF